MNRLPSSPRVLVALDTPDAERARRLAAMLDPGACGLKVGKELFTAAGPALVETFVSQGFRVFLDLKYHDIPNTVAAACAVAARLGVWMVNVHALGGPRMLDAAREAVERHGAERPLLTAVTVLTSHDDDELAAIGFGEPAEALVDRLGRLALGAGLDGLVCSPREVTGLRREHGTGPVLVTPGIRPATSPAGDQTRIMTPSAAVRAGADHLVIGRPVTGADDPAAAMDAILGELEGLAPEQGSG